MDYGDGSHHNSQLSFAEMVGIRISMKAIKLSLGDVIAFTIALLVAFSFGFSYGNVGNQATYYPHALNHLYPDFLAYDWLVKETTPYHGRFEWIVWLTHELGSVAWWSAILNLVLVTVGIFVIYRIALAYTQQWTLVTFFIVLLVVMIDRTQTVGTS